MFWILLFLACGGPAEEEKNVLGVETRTEVEPVAPLIAATSTPSLVGPANQFSPGMPADEAEAIFDTLRHPVAKYLDKEIEGYRVISAPIDGYDTLSVTLFFKDGVLAKVDQSFALDMEAELVKAWGEGTETDNGRAWETVDGSQVSLIRTDPPLPRVVVTFPAR